MNRRESLRLIALAPLAAQLEWSTFDIDRAREKAAAARAAGRFQPDFFNEHEYETVRVLVDLIIPADDRSGSATDLGVPEFMDFMMIDRPLMQLPMRGGLAWIDLHGQERFDADFIDLTDEQQRSILDEIAYPDEADPDNSHGVVFFNYFRDLTASGFWTTEAGMNDLQYMGNTYVQKWEGAPEAEIERLDLPRAPWEVI